MKCPSATAWPELGPSSHQPQAGATTGKGGRQCQERTWIGGKSRVSVEGAWSPGGTKTGQAEVLRRQCATESG